MEKKHDLKFQLFQSPNAEAAEDAEERRLNSGLRPVAISARFFNAEVAKDAEGGLILG
jgi:hypothetical protein